MTHRRPLLFAAALVATLLLVVACRLPEQQTGGPRVVSRTPSPQRGASSPTSTGVPTATPDLATRLARNPMPPRDYGTLLSGTRDQAPAFATPLSPRSFQVGDRERFWVGDLGSARMYHITATLCVETDLVQMWVEQGLEVERDELEHSARFFEEQIYPVNHDYFGSEWSPGIDGDPHLIVLNAHVQGAAGYFALANEYPREVNPYSNEREMFVMNAAAVKPGTPAYHAILAHEFQHMIHWHLDRNEDAWLNEGASELAEELNGFTISRSAVTAFERRPDLQLNTWTADPETMSAHYGASHLFLRYTLSRFGPETLRAVVQNRRNGIWSFDAPLKKHDPALTFDALFADWVLANALDQSTLADERYVYPDMNVKMELEETVQSYPRTIEGSVHQYAADYLELVGTKEEPATPDASSSLQITFTGTPQVKLVPNTPASGRFQWWSNRGDGSHSYLERTFDLTEVSTATLSFNLWYDIEKNWDYAYVRASTDGGHSWHLLQGTHMQPKDKSMHALGPGYTGRSGTGDEEAKWVREHIDLSAFCGDSVTVRFDYVTDDAVNAPGLCLDDFDIQVLQFEDDVESGENGWHAEGFIRHDNHLKQNYVLKLVEFSSAPRIRRIPVDARRRGWALIEGFGDTVSHALLIVAATAPATTETASYRIELEELP